MKRVVFKAQLGDGPVQEVGGYEMLPDEWEHELAQYGGDENAWLNGTGIDWAHEEASAFFRAWAEFEE